MSFFIKQVSKTGLIIIIEYDFANIGEDNTSLIKNKWEDLAESSSKRCNKLFNPNWLAVLYKALHIPLMLVKVVSNF